MGTKSDSRPRIRYDVLPGFSTYGAVVPSTAAAVFQTERSRSWTTLFKNKRAMYQSLLANGYLPTTPYTDRTYSAINSKVITFTGKLYDPRSDFSWSIIPGTPPYNVTNSDNWYPALIASVQEQLQSRISGHGTNVYVSAAEAKSTVGMVADAVSRFSTGYAQVRRGQFAAAAKTFGLGKVPRGVSKRESVMNNWLEYRYGWRLVVKDITGLLETLHDSLVNRPPLLRVTAKAQRTGTYNWTSPGSLTTPNGVSMANYTQVRTVKFTTEVRGGYVYTLSSVPLATGQAFGMTNPFVVAWELIPYSFVLDWITNIGSVLEGLTAFQGKQLVDGWLCKAVESETSYTWKDFVKTGVYSLKTPGTVLLGPVFVRDFSRVPMGFTPASIRLELDLNISRVLDAVSLVNQQTNWIAGKRR